MPAASDDLMHSFYPLLANAMIQADLNSVEDEGSAAIGALACQCTLSPHMRSCVLVFGKACACADAAACATGQPAFHGPAASRCCSSMKHRDSCQHASPSMNAFIHRLLLLQLWRRRHVFLSAYCSFMR